MYEIPDGLRYTKEHEYLKSTNEDGVYQVGITDYAQGELGDVVFVELPEIGNHFDIMAIFGTIEAVKAVSDVYCPLAGEVVGVNQDLDDDPSLLNSDPYGSGWMILLRVTDENALEDLLDSWEYQDLIGE